MKAAKWFDSLSPRLQERVKKHIIADVIAKNPDWEFIPEDPEPKTMTSELVYRVVHAKQGEALTPKEIYDELKDIFVAKEKDIEDIKALLELMTNQRIIKETDKGFVYQKRA